MAIYSPILGELRGSIGGNTFSRNKGGVYVRQRGVPTNPNSTRQQVVRSLVATYAQYWGGVLDADERAAWNTYAQEHPVLNSLGQEIYLTGLDWYVKINTRLADAALTPLTEPPVEEGPGSLATITPTLTSPAGLSLAFAPVLEEDECIVCWASLPQKGGTMPNFRQCRLVGYSAVAQATPAVFVTPFTYQVGERAVIYATRMDEEGQLGGFLKSEDVAA
jgi:hypothetical protein